MTTSLLATKLSTEAVANGGVPWSPIEGAVELLASSGAGLAPAVGTYDTIVFTPPTNPTSIVYKSGGLSGTVVSTLTLVYSGDDIQSIVRS